MKESKSKPNWATTLIAAVILAALAFPLYGDNALWFVRRTCMVEGYQRPEGLWQRDYALIAERDVVLKGGGERKMLLFASEDDQVKSVEESKRHVVVLADPSYQESASFEVEFSGPIFRATVLPHREPIFEVVCHGEGGVGLVCQRFLLGRKGVEKIYPEVLAPNEAITSFSSVRPGA
ncbi:hypothetical protein [Blastopirellula marina]|uniref:Uncharacterized protein n=1 Tax=Blastopirellula marina TaxID=124 RepID=A0A2S8GSD8_9BACT|nr:hypothetical protein [Blastopirellula marina]PQO26431.1 hypothetical protein C5Y98_30295 [Blastopirellula marina]PQO46934.1 hypothetical protein C5Y93_07215 [Blastopirellula marina]PTL40744.1 hypothetical protein C5Y97_30310 [Blastopirellula marina]